MTCSRMLSLAFTLAMFSSAAFADKKQAEAASIIDRAKQLSDIRAAGAPAFRLKMSFKATSEDGSALEGTYTEIWLSKAQWSRETVAGDFRRTVVAAGKERWLLDSGKSSMEQVLNLPALSKIPKFQPESWTPERIKNRKLNGSSVRCIETVDDVRTLGERTGGIYASCFDSTGLLAAEVAPLEKGNRGGDKSCFFFDYQKFGDRMFPRSYKCTEAGHLRLEAKIVELVIEPHADPETFARPEGAKELTGCPDSIRQPKLVHQTEPGGPVGSGVVAVALSVGVGGAPYGLTVVSTPNAELGTSALEYVRQWRFMPATCDGEPIEVKISVEVDTHIR